MHARWALIFSCTTLAAQQNGYVGARRCGACHPAQFAKQSATGHAKALRRAAQHPLMAWFVPEVPLMRDKRYTFEFRLSQNEFRVRAFDERNVMDIPIEWAFGAGAQAVTFVTRVNEDWYLEHYFSYYSEHQSLAPTPGQSALKADTLPLAMGLLYRTAERDIGILGCFECHSTGPVSVTRNREIHPLELGVHCEACHGPGGRHAAGEIGLIQNPKRLSAPELNQFCGRCHRPPAVRGVEIDWSYAWNVRHQPVYLSQSACFRKSEGKLSCLTCHNPHEPLRRDDPAYYNSRCALCHENDHRSPARICQTTQLTGCVSCHMPRVSPQPHLRFTNHWIGTYQPGETLKPRR